MKKNLLVLFAGIASLASAQSHNGFISDPWSSVLKKAKSENKYILLDAYTDWCYWCKVMDKQTFPDTSVANMISKNFVAVRKEMEHDEGIDLSMKYHVAGYPSFLVFSPEGKMVYRISGYQKPDEFKATLTKALDPATQMHFPGIGDKLDPGFPDFYKKSFGVSKKTVWPEEQTVTDFLDKQTDPYSEVSWSVMSRFSLNEKWNNWILEHEAELSSKYGQDDVMDKMQSIVNGRLRSAIKSKDETKFEESLKEVDKLKGVDPEMVKFQFRLSFHENQLNWKKYSSLIEEKNTAGKLDNNMLNSVSWNIYEKCKEKETLSKACGWMKSVCEKEPLYMYLDTYAALLYATDQYAEARTWAEKAITTGKASGEDVKSTESLLEYIKAKQK